MGDPAIDHAISRRQEILDELKDLDTFIRLYKRFAVSGTQVVKVVAAAHHGSRPRSSPASEVLPAIERIMVERKNQPITPSGLVAELEDRGFVIGGSRPGSTISAMLSHSVKFKSMGKKVGWVLADYKPTSSGTQGLDNFATAALGGKGGPTP